MRKLAFSIAFGVVFLAVGWSAYWYVAHRLASSELEAALARESREGRIWSCESMQNGGYPFAIDIACDRLTIRARTAGGELVAHARGAVVRAPLYTPKRLSIDVESPGDVSLDGDALHVDLAWRTLQISARGLPDRMDRFSVAGADAVVQTNLDPTPTRVAAFQVNLRRAIGADTPLNYEISLAGVRSPWLDFTIGGADPALLASIGTITQVDRTAAGSGPERLERWRAAGGRVVVTQLSLIKGMFATQVEGALGLDQGRRIDGKLDVLVQNPGVPLANLTQRFGLGSLPLAEIAGSLFGGGKSGESRFAISFENGRLGVGPLKGLAVLPPLY